MKKIFGPKFRPKSPKSGPKLGYLSFFMFDALVFIKIEYNDSLQQRITSIRKKLSQKGFGEKIWVKTGQNQAQNLFFCHFLKFGLLVFL